MIFLKEWANKHKGALITDTKTYQGMHWEVYKGEMSNKLPDTCRRRFEQNSVLLLLKSPKQ